jgi:putative oxidoreductase
MADGTPGLEPGVRTGGLKPVPMSGGKMRIKTIVMWLLTLLLAASMLNAGLRKFFENGGWSWAFRNWGYSVEFRIFIGLVETAAALLLLYPRTAAYGAASVMAVMVGAIGTFAVTSGRIQFMIPAIVTLAVAAIVLAARWSTRWLPRYSFQRRIDSTM